VLRPGNLRRPDYCASIVASTVQQLGKLDIVVSNAAGQLVSTDMAELPHTHLEDTFQVNFFALARVVQAALPHLHAGDSIIATSSISARRGNQQLVDYTLAKDALTVCIRSNFTAASREADTGQHGSAWPHLDAARPRPLPAQQGSRVRPEYHNKAPQPARQRGARLRVSGLRRCLV
jgi:hypothetical protein